MDTDAKGQLGGIECGKEARERMAKDSGAWKCATCAKSNAQIMAEREELVKESEEKEGKRKEDEVPEELRLAYRDELGNKEKQDEKSVDKGKAKAVDSPPSIAMSTSSAAPVTQSTITIPAAPRVPVLHTRTVPAPQVQEMVQRSPDRSIAWIDTCIYGIVAALLFMVLKKFA